jgi:beta-galactosidase
VHYLATRLGADALRHHLARIVADAGITSEHPQAGDGVEIVRRHAGTGSYLFVFNHSEQPRTLALTGHDLLTGTDLSGDTELAPAASVVLREAPSAD